MKKIAVAEWSQLEDRVPAYALVGNVDLVVIRYGEKVSVLFGRCHHRGALLADGFVDKHDNLICGVHQLGLPDRHRHQRIQEFRGAAEIRRLDRERKNPRRRG